MLFYISLPSWSNIKLCTMVDRERFSVFRVDHWVQKSGHPCCNVTWPDGCYGWPPPSRHQPIKPITCLPSGICVAVVSEMDNIEIIIDIINNWYSNTVVLSVMYYFTVSLSVRTVICGEITVKHNHNGTTYYVSEMCYNFITWRWQILNMEVAD
jgi:hypothetical protein